MEYYVNLCKKQKELRLKINKLGCEAKLLEIEIEKLNDKLEDTICSKEFLVEELKDVEEKIRKEEKVNPYLNGEFS